MMLVIGDACEDYYHYGTIDRVNPEAAAPLLTFQNRQMSYGMAANVWKNIMALGQEVYFSANPHPWSKKHRYVDAKHNALLLRVDHDVRAKPYVMKSPEYYAGYTAIVVSDYNKGFITDEVLLELPRHFKGPIFVDTKKTDLAKFTGMFFKINELEKSRLISEPEDLVVTCGAGGCWYKGVNYPAPKIEVVDVCGAGDTFLAAMSVYYTKTQDMAEALSKANQCAAIACTHQGVYTLRPEDIP
jgi:D-beta-D-heptose 7-phosphate kinase/D-beta-D-heptose 1-phosphate adenosyltransferase